MATTTGIESSGSNLIRFAGAAGKDIDYIGAAGSQDFDRAGDVPGDIAHWEVQSDGALKVLEVISE